MKILCITHKYRDIHFSVVKAISYTLLSACDTVETELDKTSKYDCIVVFNKKEICKYKNEIERFKCPVVYICCMSDISKEYINMPNLISQTIIIKDTTLNHTFFPYMESCSITDMVYSIPEYSEIKIGQKRRLTIIIDINNNFMGNITLFRLLPLLNQLKGYDIYYNSHEKINKSLLNRHIFRIRSKQDLDRVMNIADILIGSGLSVINAVSQRKKVIIAGELGYGGFVTHENIEHFAQNFFQGRNGGKINEHIPVALIINNLEKSIDFQLTYEKLHQISNAANAKLLGLIQSVIPVETRDINERQFIFNHMNFRLIKHNGVFSLKVPELNRVYKRINESEAAVLSEFYNPSYIKDILPVFPSEYENDILDFIRESIDNKLIVPI